MTSSSQVAVALIIEVVSYILTRYLHLTIDNPTITTTVQTIITVGTSVWALVAHKKVVNQATTQGVNLK